MTNHPNRSNFKKLQSRAKNEIGMDLFSDRVYLSGGGDGPGVYKFHLRADAHSAAWPHFKTLDDVAAYLDIA